MTNKIKNIIVLALVALIVIIGLMKCGADKANKELLSQIDNYKLSEQQFITKRLEDSSTLVKQQQTFLTQKEALQLKVLDLEDKMKRVSSQVKYTTKTKYEEIEVAFIPEGYADTTGISAQYTADGKPRKDSIAVPQEFELNQKWLSIRGRVNFDGLTIDSMSIPNSTTVTVGYERKNLFSRLEPVVTLKNENPYVQVTGISNVIIKKKKSIFQSKLFWFTAGVVAATAADIAK